MYLRSGIMKFLKVKNVLLFIAGVFFLFVGSYLIADLMITYRNDIDTALHAKSMPVLRLSDKWSRRRKLYM